MAQGEAVQTGYSPALGEPCGQVSRRPKRRSSMRSILLLTVIRPFIARQMRTHEVLGDIPYRA